MDRYDGRLSDQVEQQEVVIKGWEMMVVNMLKGMGFDPDTIMREVNMRVENFEACMKALNETLEAIKATQERHDQMLLSMCEAMNIQPPKSQTYPLMLVSNQNDVGSGGLK